MKMTDKSADVRRLTGAAGPKLSASAPVLNADELGVTSKGAHKLKSAGASRVMKAGAPRILSAAVTPRQKSAAAPKPGADAPKLYPDLAEFYAPSASQDDHRPPSSPSTDLGSPPPPQTPGHRHHHHRLLPTAPPLWLDSLPDNSLPATAGGNGCGGGDEEILLSWEDLVELVPDYDMDMDDTEQTTASHNRLNNNLTHRHRHQLDLTDLDNGLQNLSWDDVLELEPDYDDDDNASVHHHHQGNLNDLLNNLNVTAAEEEGKAKILLDKNIEIPDDASDDLQPCQRCPPPPRPRRPPPSQGTPARCHPLPPRGRPPTVKVDDGGFRAWLTWRLQANRQLAAVILTREGKRKRVLLRQSEMRRKPLTRHVVQKVAQQAQGGGGAGGGEGGRAEGGRGGKGVGGGSADRTSLPACPYVMYGIPRVNLPAANSSPATRRRADRDL